jgi:hypothetical protein
VDSTNLGYVPVHGSGPSSPLKGEKFIDLNDYQLLKKHFAQQNHRVYISYLHKFTRE